MAPSGPLPTGTAIRRNKPTIPTTNLPASGRSAPIPDPPALYHLGPSAMDWWGWAWTTPQACAWDDGALFAVARRAQLEDDLHAIEQTDSLGDLIGADPDELALYLRSLIGGLKALAGGKLGIAREMRELDDRLGLTPRGLAANRWKIVDVDEGGASGGSSKPSPKKRGRALHAVSASA